AKHLVKLFTRVKRKISNGLPERFNSRIQQIKMATRGFRSFRNYRVSILFYLGALDVNP
ncbi:MAG: ISL3 family transposase, partial [Candidatus Neomarinimicrobiota bacterium]